MTIIEWIELAQVKINAARVTDWRFNNVTDIDDAIKCLNEAKVLIAQGAHLPCAEGVQGPSEMAATALDVNK